MTSTSRRRRTPSAWRGRNRSNTKRLPVFTAASACPREFDRTLTVPVEIDPEGIKAQCRDGVLALFIPIAEKAKPGSIEIS